MLSNFDFDVELQLTRLEKGPDSALDRGAGSSSVAYRPRETFGATFPLMRSQ
jgi:hypothetical protein